MRRDLLLQAQLFLKAAHIENAPLDARLLLQHALAISHENLILHGDAPVDTEQKQNYDDMIQRRAAGEPVSRIIGAKEFWGLHFTISPDVLDPRPDSETLIKTALTYYPDKNRALRILDLGTGSGCLLIALLHEYKNANGVGVDQSREALKIAAQNAVRNHVESRAQWLQGDWWQDWDGRLFDLIISNPPYIAESNRTSLAREVVNHDPEKALFGGPDGLDCYRIILSDLKSHLTPDGFALLEIGFDQAETVPAIAAANSLIHLETVRDLGNNPRCVVLKSD